MTRAQVPGTKATHVSGIFVLGHTLVVLLAGIKQELLHTEYVLQSISPALNPQHFYWLYLCYKDLFMCIFKGCCYTHKTYEYSTELSLSTLQLSSEFSLSLASSKKRQHVVTSG